MKTVFIALFTMLTFNTSFASTENLSILCEAQTNTSADQVVFEIRDSLQDILLVSRQAQARGLSKFANLRYTLTTCQNEVANSVIQIYFVEIDLRFQICHHSQSRCVATMITLLDQLK